ncbi:MAG TPA: glutamate-5-semialdehyde dehydrogenase [Fermentimonas caenicola]|jgi:glutamate-5-semialdehyde dehydrogenase|uniref:glutamate-5-semialdehyde dehydrogenase n=1 Tax=Lascolabacillus TaxID=1924067 RepID=UPI0006B38E59|nr:MULTISPECIES: glutamate-5-semialdehyde dehydrogenase [Lascolabacillus]MBP6174668.1 glutamate-5-semialdehyde dehydrogenase [Fermentimonas sp.]MDI9625011.1 glutamate-5-semialdehyde dehydrogenase [Bacteroidota bacterium]TAH61600.1 MAG: glutamate-5-semialdehyde dehydrogenase [Fermentimonas caenicola]MCK9500463.1 glutamate-5-semialdehyde dehydrogenase [Lascolabacillus sp.]MDD2606203.1 glutamate-5-semialdehyde dehydrogenase [Lascolabacillus sp.]
MDIIIKNSVLSKLSELIKEKEQAIIDANNLDIETFPEMDESMKDRLKVDKKKIGDMIKSLEEVAAQDDPEGKELYNFTRKDGLHIVNKTVPFGTILIIYESRPDVTIEAAATAFKAGNKILLKGGKESLNTNTLLTELWQKALSDNNVDKNYVEYLNLSHSETQKLIKENTRKVDLIIPRGGERLIQFVLNNSSVPVIVSGRGNNFLFIDDNVDFEMATQLVINGKKRISVCNAIDKVLIHRSMNNIQERIKFLVKNLKENGIDVWGNSEITKICNEIKEENDVATLCEEYLAPKLYVSLVDDLKEAIEMINQYSGGHTAVIATNNQENAYKFMQEVDCAAVYHNASSRFTDGGQFGVGAEIAISTQKLHFRGPLGSQELVTNKWFVYGEGHIRE